MSRKNKPPPPRITRGKFTEASVTASLCEDSFYEYVKEAWPHIESAPFIDNWHIGCICEHLEAVTRGEIDKLVINIPPGCSKSLLGAVLWPTWEWASNPTVRWFFSSYQIQLALRDSVKCRTLIQGEWYQGFWGDRVQLADDQNQKTIFTTTRGGYRMATTVQGYGTGEHPDRIVIDDAHSATEAESDTERQNVLDWYDLQMSSRGVARSARRVIIGQRLNENDLPGHVMRREGWETLIIPMRYEENRVIYSIPEGKKDYELRSEVRDCIVATKLQRDRPELRDPRTEDGELLTPLFPEDKVRELERNWGEYGTAGQGQQRPRPRSGGMFKEIYFNNTARAAPYEAVRVRAWDRACLVAGTLVETDSGPVPIENIRAGNLVLTRQGLKEVEWSGVTKTVCELMEVEFSDGSVLSGTADHPVWTENRGWVALADVFCGGYDIMIALGEISTCRRENRTLKLLSSTERRTPVAPENGTSKLWRGTQSPVATERIPFTGPSGGSTTGTFQTAMTSTIRTAIGTTTLSKILNAWLDGITTVSMTPLPSGTRNRRPRSRGSVTAGRYGIRQCIGTITASTAVGYSDHGTTTLEDSSSVVLCAEIDLGWPSGIVSACPAVARLAEPPGRVTARRVARVRARRPVPVYDLTVRDAHEFFANGILVHNSTQDAGCYTAGLLMAKDREGKIWVEHCVHGQWEPNERNKIILATAKADRRRYGPKYEPVIWIERELGASGKEAFQYLARQLMGFRVREWSPTGNKDVRAEPWADQLAAGNVWFVDHGWDLKGYIDEHLNFKPEAGKRGKYKDRVDASAMAFSLICKARTYDLLRTRPLREHKRGKDGKLLVIACSLEQLSELEFEGGCLLVMATDPSSETQPEIFPETDSPSLRIDDRLLLSFADIAPEEVQDRWEEPVEPYGVLPQDLILTPDQGKTLWSFLLRNRQVPPGAIIFCGGGRKPLSMAAGFCEALRLPRNETLLSYSGSPESDRENSHVFEVVKRSRARVV